MRQQFDTVSVGVGIGVDRSTSGFAATICLRIITLVSISTLHIAARHPRAQTRRESLKDKGSSSYKFVK